MISLFYGCRCYFLIIDSMLSDRESGAKPAGGPALKGMSFFLDSDLERPKVEVKNIIEKLGGRITSRISDKVAAVLTSKRNSFSVLKFYLWNQFFYLTAHY